MRRTTHNSPDSIPSLIRWSSWGFAIIVTLAVLAPRSLAVDGSSQWLTNARFLGDRFVAWQSPYGSTDLEKCPHRSPPGTATIGVVQGIGPQTRALYKLFSVTGDARYKQAADRYAVFVLSTLHDPPTPLTNKIEIEGKTVDTNSSAWVYGKSLSPCYEWFVANNPREDLLDLKAHAIYRWLQRHRRDDSYFGVGYPNSGFADAQFSCDLGEVGTGLVGFHKATGHPGALNDAFGLAEYFLTEHQPGTAKGVWSSKLGTWLVGPWPGGGAEHFTGQQYDKVGWGWSCYVVGEFLLELRKLTDDENLRRRIDDRCVRAFQWCLDECQFEDGAHGMFGRDDKWVGQTAAAILLYVKLKEMDLLPADIETTYRPKISQSWRWMLANTGPDTFPADGYIKVTGSTTTKPPENLMWMMSWTVEALLAGGPEFAATPADS